MYGAMTSLRLSFDKANVSLKTPWLYQLTLHRKWIRSYGKCFSSLAGFAVCLSGFLLLPSCLLEESSLDGLLLASFSSSSPRGSCCLKSRMSSHQANFSVLPSRLLITPITLMFSLQLSPLWCSQLSPVLYSTLDLFCGKRGLLLRWTGSVTGHPFLTF